MVPAQTLAIEVAKHFQQEDMKTGKQEKGRDELISLTEIHVFISSRCPVERSWRILP
jgi:hypothetical protein